MRSADGRVRIAQKGLWMVLESHPRDVVVFQKQDEGGKLKVIAMKRYSEGMGTAPEIFFDKPILRRQRIAVRRRIETNATSKEITTTRGIRGWWNSLFTMPVPQRS